MFRQLTFVLGICGVLLFTPAASGQTLPAPWQWTDIGAVGTPGEVHVGANNDWLVSGAGSNIWGSADSFVFAYRPIRDGQIFATIDGETNTNGFAKAGIMIRQTLAAGSPEIILDVKPDGGIEFMKRASAGGQTTFIAGGHVPVSIDASGNVTIGVDLQFARLGRSVSAAFCYQGACTSLGTIDFVDGPALVGIAVTSADPTRLNHAHLRVPPTVDTVPGTSVDVGKVGTPGFATYEEATGRFFVSGAGSNIWGTADSFHYVWQRLTGDSQLTARVVSERDTGEFAKAGLTIGDASPSAARVILDVKPDGGIEFMTRATSGGSMTFVAGSTMSFPVWLRLTRAGNTFTGEISHDGQAWTTVGTTDVALSSSVPGGFAVTSENPALLNAAVLDNFAETTGLDLSPVGPNLLVNPGFEESVLPQPGPGWVSDRRTPAVAETTLPHSGMNDAACRTTTLDCGIRQDVTDSNPQTGNRLFRIYARADHPGALIGVNVDGKLVVSARIQPGGYQPYTLGFFTPNPNAVIRVWMFAPPVAGVVAIDDAELVEYLGPM